jgi:hypothetical protein
MSTITNKIQELELQANQARGLGELTRINHELENLREQQAENMLLGEYETGCSVEEYQRYRVRW